MARVPTQRQPSDTEPAGDDEPAAVVSSDDPDTPAGTEPADRPSGPDPAPTLVSARTATRTATGGPADATTPARPHSVRAIATAITGSPGTEVPARRRRLVAVALVLVVMLAGAVWIVTRNTGAENPADRQGDTPANPQASQTQASQPVEPSGGSTGDPPPATIAPTTNGNGGGGATARPPLPAGWRDYTDSTGFSVYVPAHWRVERDGRMVYFRGDGRSLGIDQTDQPRPDPVADWRGQAATRVRKGDFPNYNEIRIEAVPYWQKAADWEFTYGSGSRRSHVNNRGLVVSERKAYGIWWQVPDSEWAAARPDLQLVFDSFRPAPTAIA